MTTTCPCGKPTRDAAYVCDDDLTRLDRALGEMPWIIEELGVTMTKQKSPVYDATRSTERALPLHIGALEASTKLNATLNHWVIWCIQNKIRHQAPTNHRPQLGAIPASRWLHWRIDGLAFHPEGHAAVTDITEAAHRAKRIIDNPPEQRYAGPCECGRDIYHRPGATTVTCKECGNGYDVGELYEWMRAGVMGRLVTAKEGAGLLGKFNLPTALSTIYAWQKSGRIMERPSPDKAKLFLIDDLFELAAKNMPKVG